MSRPQFVLTPEARGDVIEIWNYIAEDSIDHADQVLARLYDAFTRLGQTPGIGHHRGDLADIRYRFWAVHSYVIAYRWETMPVQGLINEPDFRSQEVLLPLVTRVLG